MLYYDIVCYNFSNKIFPSKCKCELYLELLRCEQDSKANLRSIFFLHRDLDNFAVSNESTANYRSSRPEVFCKKGVLKGYAKFKGKHLCQSLLFLIKLQASGLQLY